MEKKYYLHAFYQDLVYSKDSIYPNESFDSMMIPLKSILEHGILSKKLLTEKGINTLLGVKFSPINLNGENYVSLVKVDENSKLISFGSNALKNISNYPAIIINPIIEKELIFRKSGKMMVNEVQVQDRVDPKYFIGLRMPYHPDKCKNLTELNELKEKLIILNNFVARYNITVYEQRTLKPILESINKK